MVTVKIGWKVKTPSIARQFLLITAFNQVEPGLVAAFIDGCDVEEVVYLVIHPPQALTAVDQGDWLKSGVGWMCHEISARGLR